MLVLDSWERMINVQSALKRLVFLGLEGDFTLIQPFMHESKVSLSLSLPEMFQNRNMTPQTADTYFRTTDLEFTRRYARFEVFQRNMRVKNTNIYLIHAAVYFDWELKRGKKNVPLMHWCDERLSEYPRSPYGRALTPVTHVAHALCINPYKTSAQPLCANFFEHLFRFVRDARLLVAHKMPTLCEKCVSVALMNYRKHAFAGYVNAMGVNPFSRKVPPLFVSDHARVRAAEMKRGVLGGRYLAVHIRTGKMYTLLEKRDEMERRQGNNLTIHHSFQQWVFECARSVVKAAKKEMRKRRVRRVYIASDMLNSGWKGGEIAPAPVEKVLDAVKGFMKHSLNGISFDARRVEQDGMGTAGVIDAAVCLDSDAYLYAAPSNFGQWVKEMRAVSGRQTMEVSCAVDGVNAG